jgi:hypothetical protein
MAWLHRLTQGLRSLLGAPQRAKPGRGGRDARRGRIHLEPLEDRMLPAGGPPLPANVNTPTQWGSLPGPATNYTVQLTGDFNGDGLTDIAGLNSNGTWYVGLSHRDGFRASAWGSGWGTPNLWVTFKVGDFNGNGKQDIAGLDINGNWWVALSTGSSFTKQLWATGWASSAPWLTTQVTDLNGDGRSDLAGFDSQGRWWVAMSTGSSFQVSFAATNWAEGTVWYSFQSGDFMGNGKNQIAALNTTGQWWMLSYNGGTFDTQDWLGPWSIGSAPATVQVGDFDGNGKDDIAAFYSPGQWFEFRSTGSFFQVVNIASGWTSPSHWVSFQSADFDGDGRDEIAGMLADGEIWMLQVQGPGSPATRWSYPMLPSAATTLQVYQPGDVNGDGRPDFILRDATGQFYAALSSGYAFFYGAPNSRFFFVAPWDLQEVNNPNTFQDLFNRYKHLIRSALGPAFSGLNDTGVGFVLATEIAYEHASYRGSNDPQGRFPTPNPFSIGSLLAVPKLVCTEYVYLDYYLFRNWDPYRGSSDPVQISMVGWNGGTVGNHSQMLVTGIGLPLLLDPTTGLIAITSLSSLRSGVFVPTWHIADLSVRVETSAYFQASTSTGRMHVDNALRKGLYTQSTLLYNTPLDLTYYHGAVAQ